MKLTSRPMLPPPPMLEDKAVQAYLQSLHRALLDIFSHIYVDMSQGQGTLTGYTSAPATTDLDNNQLVLRTDAANEAIYTKIDGTIKSVSLT